MTNLLWVWAAKVRRSRWPGVLVVLLLAFGLRLAFLVGSGLHIDEYITILAVQAVERFGYPLLPSGTFYNHGLPFVYVDAGFWILGGSGAVIARFPALLFGVMAVAMVYRMGRRWFSHQVGLYAATILATTTTVVIWGARARMYTLQQLCFMLAVFGLVEGFRQNSRWYRVMGVLAAMLAVTTHHLTIAFLFAFALSVLSVIALVYRFRVRLPVKVWSLWPEALMILIGCGLLLAGRSIRGLWEGSADPQASSRTLLDLKYMIAYLMTDVRTLFAPENLIAHLLGGFHPFIVFPDLVLTLFFVVGSLFLLLRLVRRRPRSNEAILLLIWLTLLSGVTGIALFLVFKADRYLIPLTPFYCLVVGHELDFIGRRLSTRRPRRVWAKSAVNAVIWVLLLCLMIPPAIRVATSNPIVLDCAWEYVRDNWKAGDAVATCMPAAAYGWLRQLDYFAMETGYVTLETEDGLVDIWLGAPLVDSPGRMREALRSHDRLWFVIDERAWEWFYSEAFREVVEVDMVRVSECPGMRVYVSRD